MLALPLLAVLAVTVTRLDSRHNSDPEDVVRSLGLLHPLSVPLLSGLPRVSAHDHDHDMLVNPLFAEIHNLDPTLYSIRCALYSVPWQCMIRLPVHKINKRTMFQHAACSDCVGVAPMAHAATAYGYFDFQDTGYHQRIHKHN